MVWALENPQAGIVEADEMDYRRCLEVQTPYLGPVEGHFTEWNPLTDRLRLFPDGGPQTRLKLTGVSGSNAVHMSCMITSIMRWTRVRSMVV